MRTCADHRLVIGASVSDPLPLGGRACGVSVVDIAADPCREVQAMAAVVPVEQPPDDADQRDDDDQCDHGLNYP